MDFKGGLDVIITSFFISSISYTKKFQSHKRQGKQESVSFVDCLIQFSGNWKDIVFPGVDFLSQKSCFRPEMCS